jgi:hypothetical protein
MPVIHFNASDALQTTVVAADIYPSEVTQITGPTKSQSGKSVNLFFDITICEGKYKGKTRTITFSTGSNSVNLMGDMQFFPQAYLLMLDAAISGREVKPEDYNLDTDTLLHKPFDASWGVTTVDGHMVNVINSFHPRGYGSSGPAF